MKIGVFGDSFASSIKINKTPSWIDILVTEFKVDTYGVPGSSFFYSINKFKEHSCNQYDKIIFIVTSPSRIKISDDIPCEDGHKRHVGGSKSIRQLMKEATSRDNITTDLRLLLHVYRAADDYYSYIQDDLYDTYVHKLMYEDIKRTNHNMILIPAFKNSFKEEVSVSLADIYFKENKGFGFEHIPYDEVDVRNCHMTAENNLILGNKLINCLKTGTEFNMSLDEFVTPSNKEFYIKKYE